jgi:hypothetical protein
MTYVLALLATLALSGPAAAQHVHGAKGPNGGQMEDVAGVHAELMTAGNTITINVFDEGNKPNCHQGLYRVGARPARSGTRNGRTRARRGGDADGRSEKAGCRSCHHGHAENGCGEVRAGQIQAVEPLMTRRRRANPQHIDSLPAEIRSAIAPYARVCGGPLAAEHSFVRYFQSGTAKLIGLHFEHLRCSNRAAVCTAAGCLHQVYISTGGRYRLLRSSYVPELDLTQVKIPPR